MEEVFSSLLGINIDIGALLSGNLQQAFSALAGAFDITYDFLKRTASEAGIPDDFLDQAVGIVQALLSGQPIDLPDLKLPSISELYDDIKKLVVDGVTKLVKTAIRELIGLLTGAGALDKIWNLIKALLSLWDQAQTLVSFIMKSLCAAVNCSEDMIEKIGQALKALLLGLIGPILAAIACTLLASWIKALRELLASIKAVIKAFLLKIFKAIKDWLLGKSGKGGQGAACATQAEGR